MFPFILAAIGLLALSSRSGKSSSTSAGSKLSTKPSPVSVFGTGLPINDQGVPDLSGNLCNLGNDRWGITDEEGECQVFFNQDSAAVLEGEIFSVYDEMGQPSDACDGDKYISMQVGWIENPTRVEILKKAIARAWDLSAAPANAFPPSPSDPEWVRFLWDRATAIYTTSMCGGEIVT